MNFIRLIPENIIKIILIISLFLASFVVFKMFQKPQIYNATLKNITHTYVQDSVNLKCIWKVQQPFYYMDTMNTVRWDGRLYYEISKDFYKNGDWKYGFFPLFPMIWRISHISSLYIGLFNYLLFGLSILILFNCFFNAKTGTFSERMAVFIIALILPTITVYYLPYAEGIFTLTFALAMWGLIKKKYWIYFISMFFFAMSRPVFVHVGLAFLMMEGLNLLKHQNIKHFLKETTLKLLPLISGTLLVFFIFYLSSGSFFKYFEAINTFWKASFSIPSEIQDWSIESFGMNVFTIFFLIIPCLIFFCKHFLTLYLSKNKKEDVGVFSGDISSIREYFLFISIIYFTGVLVFTLFYQNGSLNGLNRYIFASPFFYIFLFGIYPRLKNIKTVLFLIFSGLLLSASLFMLTGFQKIDPNINFNDFGFFILLADLLFLYFFKRMNKYVRITLMGILVFISIVIITYLYNIYLCNGWIYT